MRFAPERGKGVLRLRNDGRVAFGLAQLDQAGVVGKGPLEAPITLDAASSCWRARMTACAFCGSFQNAGSSTRAFSSASFFLRSVEVKDASSAVASDCLISSTMACVSARIGRSNDYGRRSVEPAGARRQPAFDDGRFAIGGRRVGADHHGLIGRPLARLEGFQNDVGIAIGGALAGNSDRSE